MPQPEDTPPGSPEQQVLEAILAKLSELETQNATVLQEGRTIADESNYSDGFICGSVVWMLGLIFMLHKWG